MEPDTFFTAHGSLAIIAALVALSFLLGSIPAAYIAFRLAKGKDIRTVGSGNSGATNAYRALGLKGAIPTLAFDFLKGAASVFLALRLVTVPGDSRTIISMVCGTAAMLGHVFSPWLGFRGGKGVATGAGVISVLYPPLIPICLAVFCLVFALTRIASAASLAAAASAPLGYIALRMGTGKLVDPLYMVFLGATAIIVFITHVKNVRDLLKGKEKRVERTE